MFEELHGKKLLVIGGDVNDINIINTAHEMGVYVISTDRNTNYDRSPAKKLADEAWDIDYADPEAIAKKCIEKNVDGVMAGYSEFRVLAAAKVSALIGKPFYATEEQIEITRSKRTFKDLCMKFGVPTPKDYCYAYPITDDEKDRIEYPVIVKPTDYAGCKGISVCYNRQQLEEAIEFAVNLSISKTIIIEDYIVGTELMAIYTIVDGEASLSCLNEKYISQDHERISGLCDVVLTPSKYYDMYMSTTNEKIKGFLKGIGAKNGVAFFQFIANETAITAFEMGYRLNGNNDYKVIKRYNDINYMKMLISYSLTGKMGDDIKKDNPVFRQYLCTLLTYVHAGTVGKVEYSALNGKEGIDDIYPWVTPGKQIVEDGSTQQRGISVKISAYTLEEIAELICFVQNNISVIDTNGNDMFFKHFDTNRLFLK